MARFRAVRGSALLMAVVALAGCGSGFSWISYPSPPSTIFRPTIVGVEKEVEVSTTFPGLLITLTDGRTIEEREKSGVTRLGRDGPGVLLLARDTDPRFIAGLPPSVPGCWEGWPGPPGYSIVWDMGDSLLFSYNSVELPKASGFSVDEAPETHDGHPAWVYNAGDARRLSFCVNDKGQVAWARTVP